MFHLDKWNKNGKNMATYLNDNATNEEFETFNQNVIRLEDIVTDETKELFNSKDSFIWMALFNKFAKLNMEDSKFADFLNAFVYDLRKREVDGQLFDTVDQSGSTKDKAVVVAKLHILETLMNEFLHINKDDLEDVDTLEFVKENVKADATEEDVEFYSDILDDLTVEVDNNTKLLDKQNRPSLIALVGYACENDIDLDEWIKQWFVANTIYILNQKRNFEIMVQALQKGVVA